MTKHAFPTQYSVFVFPGNDLQLQGLLDGLRERINEKEDDIRAYHVTADAKIWALGVQGKLNGVFLSDLSLNQMVSNQANFTA